jgi:hypothetical protein
MFIYRAIKAFFPTVFPSAASRQEQEGAEGNLQNVVICKTIDEVNIDLARRWCDEDGLIFRLADPADDLFPAGVSAMVIDLNHLALQPRERVHFVERLANLVPPYPVAVASYDLEPEAIETLKGQGYLVFRRIERQMFYELAHTLGRGYENVVVRLRDGRNRQGRVNLEQMERRAARALCRTNHWQ